jgi:uncharacterized damage-inducible protein DinB
MAHVLKLPGCHVAAADKPQALEQLPAAIRAYYHDLIRHGEAVFLPTRIDLAVAEEQTRSGHFHPDDRAALFEPERRPLTPEEVTRYLRLASFNRLDLLDLVRGFADGILDWTPSPEAMSIRRILTHIGRADQWYISRISGAAAGSPDWRTLPTRRYLTQARSNASQRFLALNAAELTQITHPPDDDGDRSEAWTARKALRRFLEHEREHTAHIAEILAQWRQHLLARLVASRSRFIWQLISLDESDLVEAPLFPGEGDAPWTARDMLVLMADWDGLYAQRTALVGRGRTAAIKAVDLEERNAVLAESAQDATLEEALGGLRVAREGFLVALGSVSDAGLHWRFQLPSGQRTTLAAWARRRYRHDDRHTKDLLAWRARVKPVPAAGPKRILQAALESGRQEMLATAALVPARQRQTRQLCGVWTLKDVLGHVADWEWYGVEKLEGPRSRRSLAIRFRGIQRWNEAHAAARKEQSWDQVWSDFQAARLALGQMLEKMSQEDLAQPFAVPWSKEWTVYRWLHLWLHHEREHAADLRANLALPGWPERLKRFR